MRWVKPWLKRSVESKPLSRAKGAYESYESILAYTVVCASFLLSYPWRLSFSYMSCGSGTQRSLSRGRTRVYGWVLRQLNKTHCCCTFAPFLWRNSSHGISQVPLMPFVCWLGSAMQHLAALANSLESLMFNTTVALERSALNSGFESEEHIHIPHSLYIHFYVLILERRVTPTFHEWRHGQFVSICWCWLSTHSKMFSSFALVLLHSNPAEGPKPY